MKVFVTVGTHEQPFQRLLDAVARAVSDRPHHEWVVQWGVGVWEQRGGRVVASSAYFGACEMRQHLEWADVVVSQASPGTVFAALEAGAWPVVVGRRASLREHVDDHQVLFARELDRRGLATDLRSASALVPELDRQSSLPRPALRQLCTAAASRSAENARRFRADVWANLQELT